MIASGSKSCGSLPSNAIAASCRAPMVRRVARPARHEVQALGGHRGRASEHHGRAAPIRGKCPATNPRQFPRTGGSRRPGEHGGAKLRRREGLAPAARPPPSWPRDHVSKCAKSCAGSNRGHATDDPIIRPCRSKPASLEQFSHGLRADIATCSCASFLNLASQSFVEGRGRCHVSVMMKDQNHTQPLTPTYRLVVNASHLSASNSSG